MQSFDRAALIHGKISLCHLIRRQGKIERLAVSIFPFQTISRRQILRRNKSAIRKQDANEGSLVVLIT